MAASRWPRTRPGGIQGMIAEIGKRAGGVYLMRRCSEHTPTGGDERRQNRMGRPPRTVEPNHPAKMSNIAGASNRI